VSGFKVDTRDNVRALEALSARLPTAKPRRAEDGWLYLTGDESLAGEIHRVLLLEELPVLGMAPQRESLERYFLDKTEGVMG
jgi:hypothetical protein